jgi:hypothetical protein
MLFFLSQFACTVPCPTCGTEFKPGATDSGKSEPQEPTQETEDTSSAQPSNEPSEPSSEIEEPSNEPIEERISCDILPTFIHPENVEFVEQGESMVFVASVNTETDLTGYSLRWENGDEQVIAQVNIDDGGLFQYSGADFSQDIGTTEVHARLITPDGICDQSVMENIIVCGETYTDDFSTQPVDWTLFGDATWNPGGWLEMTGPYQGRKGAVYNDLQSISNGVASIRFSITTGGGSNPGADGFSFTIIDVANPADLESLLSVAEGGGGLGYGMGGVYGDWVGDAITVEIDTWYNQLNSSEYHTDPTTENHIAITRNADPSDHLVWFEVPNVEDYQSHTIRVDILGNGLRVWYDGNSAIDQPVSFNFKGGHMFFTGSTGYYYNYHIFDDLEILHSCQ